MSRDKHLKIRIIVWFILSILLFCLVGYTTYVNLYINEFTTETMIKLIFQPLILGIWAWGANSVYQQRDEIKKLFFRKE